jgi:beta-mannosidase
MQIFSLAGKWEFRQAGKGAWIPAQVPGGVHTDLMAAGKIPNPFVGDNESKVQWVAETDWEYRRNFTVPSEVMAEERVYLVCDGLDTLARVRLNGAEVGRGENMFRQYRWEVKGLLKSGKNEIAVYFDSPVRYMTTHNAQNPMLGVTQAIPGGPHLRKAPCQFGWDWGPQLPPLGIWKDLRLEGYSTSRIDDVHLRQLHGPNKATIQAQIRLDRWSSDPLIARLVVQMPSGKTLQSEATLIETDATLAITIPNPELWWPNGYGAQPLYNVQVCVLKDGRDLDERSYRLGLRSLELRREPDEWGESFTFVVNGLPIFAKGSNWIPADSFPTHLTDEHMEHLIHSAAESHQNMLRVWGGGFYEEDRFYDLCDRYGILVWQDGIFSCSIYPLDEPEYLENVKVEIYQNVARLRHHASLALWCGNNEMEWGWQSWGWQNRALQHREAYDRFFHHLLPEWIAQLDPDHPYWPSSPSSNTPFEDVNGQKKGDAHYWDVWHGRKPFTAYRDQFPRFMSEFGFQSLPPIETVSTYAGKSDWNMTSYIMEYHQRSYSGNGLMIAQMTDTFLMPKDFEALVYLSMVLQAEGIRYGVEHWRRNKQRVSGTLIWQLNDCWPVASWSSLDYYGRWKALHYAARHFFAPVLLSIEDKGVTMSVHLTSDLNQRWQGSLAWSLVTLDGKVLQSGREEVSLAPLASREVLTKEFELTTDQRREVVFVCELYQSNQLVSRSLATFVPNKHLKLADPQIVTEMEVTENQLQISLTASSLARFVEVKLAGHDLVFSDNYFDIPAGETVKVTCPVPQGLPVEDARQVLQVRSLFDSF